MKIWSDAPPDWQSPIGQRIDRFLQAVATRFPDFDDRIVIFGSAAIHLRLDPTFTSADADLRVSSARIPALQALSEELGMGKSGKGSGQFYLDICPTSAFRSTEEWINRAACETRHGLPLQIPALRDILVGKMHRRRQPGQTGVVTKDLRAFERVRELTGQPTEEELLADILLCPHAWQLSLSGTASDFRLNLEDLWPVFYSKRLDVNERIIRPLLRELELAGYNEGYDWQELVRALSPTRP